MEEELSLVFEAEKKAKEILEEAGKNSARLKNEARSEAEKVLQQSREGAKKEGERIISRRISEAEDEGRELEARQKGSISEMDEVAARKEREAVDLIVKSVTEGK